MCNCFQVHSYILGKSVKISYAECSGPVLGNLEEHKKY